MRVLITGSRSWSDRLFLNDALHECVTLHRIPGDKVTLVSGHCPTGADKMCEDFADIAGWEIETHEACWRPNGYLDRGAGLKRNAEMVKLGADLCIAFIGPCSKKNCKQPQPHGSHGATHTADLAAKAGILVIKFEAV